MSNVIDLFGEEEEAELASASEIFGLLEEAFEGDDEGVHCVAICFRSGQPPLIAGNTHPDVVAVMLTLAQVSLAADQEAAQIEEESTDDTVH